MIKKAIKLSFTLEDKDGEGFTRSVTFPFELNAEAIDQGIGLVIMSVHEETMLQIKPKTILKIQ